MARTLGVALWHKKSRQIAGFLTAWCFGISPDGRLWAAGGVYRHDAWTDRDGMSAVVRVNRFGPTLGLLYAASFWGVVWYPTRLLESAGLAGAWLTLISYGAAFLVFLPFARHSFDGIRRQPLDVAFLILAAGWTNVAFVLAVLDGEVVRVVLLFYLSPVWTVLLGRWLLGEGWTRQTAIMLGLGLCGALIMLWDPRIGRVPLNGSSQ